MLQERASRKNDGETNENAEEHGEKTKIVSLLKILVSNYVLICNLNKGFHIQKILQSSWRSHS